MHHVVSLSSSLRTEQEAEDFSKMDKARVLPLMITAEGKAAAIRRIEKMRQFQTDLAAEYDCVGL